MLASPVAPSEILPQPGDEATKPLAMQSPISSTAIRTLADPVHQAGRSVGSYASDTLRQLVGDDDEVSNLETVSKQGLTQSVAMRPLGNSNIKADEFTSDTMSPPSSSSGRII